MKIFYKVIRKKEEVKKIEKRDARRGGGEIRRKGNKRSGNENETKEGGRHRWNSGGSKR